MAKQTINIGTTANDGTGDQLRAAFDKVNDNFTELYTDDAGDVGSITATAPIARDQATGAVTISLNDAGVTFAKMQNVAANSLLVRDANSSGVLTEKALTDRQILIGDGTGMTAAALSGDVTMANTGAVTIANDAVEQAMIADDAVGADQLASSAVVTASIVDDNVTQAKIADDAVGADQLASNAVVTASITDDNITHDKLENRYTASVTISGTSGATAVDWSAGTIFRMNSAITGGIEFDFDNFKKGQVITIHNLTGGYAITLDSDAATSETFNKVGGVDYDGGSTNVLQVECIDDSANAIFNYAIAAYTSDPTP